jgi:hypothetical protein
LSPDFVSVLLQNVEYKYLLLNSLAGLALCRATFKFVLKKSDLPRLAKFSLADMLFAGLMLAFFDCVLFCFVLVILTYQAVFRGDY